MAKSNTPAMILPVHGGILPFAEVFTKLFPLTTTEWKRKVLSVHQAIRRKLESSIRMVSKQPNAVYNHNNSTLKVNHLVWYMPHSPINGKFLSAVLSGRHTFKGLK